MRRMIPTIQAPAPKPHVRAFTLVEMLVVVAITVLIFGIIGVVYRNVTTLISIGKATSESLNSGRTIGDQIARDAERMIGPNRADSAGFLVIVNQRINAPVTEEDFENGITRSLRSDQLLFIRTNQGGAELEPIAPGNNTSFSGSSDADFVKVWYGHLRRTAPDGTDTGVNEAGDSYGVGRLGQTDSGAGASVPGTNQLASRWVLGRQAMFLGHESGNFVFIETDSPGSGGAWPNWEINQYGSMPWYYAGSDVLDKRLDDDIIGFGPGSDRLLPAFRATPPLTPSQRMRATELASAYGLSNPPTSMSDHRQYAEEYARTALRYAYPVPTPVPDNSPERRLRVTPNPEMDGSDPLSSRVIAQTHPYLAGNVVEFVVEFAADRLIQPVGGDMEVGQDGQVDLADTDDNDRIDEDDSGEILWYDALDTPNIHGLEDTPGVSYWNNRSGSERDPSDDWRDSGPAPSGSDVPAASTHDTQSNPSYTPLGDPSVDAFVFHHDDFSDNSFWPYLIRLRYRIADADGDIGRRVNAESDGVDNDGDGLTDETSENRFEPGRWVEQIIRVERP